MKIATIVRWTGRITAILLALFLIMIVFMVFGGEKKILGGSASDYLLFISFLSFFIGLILLWPKEKWGLILTYLGFAGVMIIQLSAHERDTINLLYLLIPPTLILIARLLGKNNRGI